MTDNFIDIINLPEKTTLNNDDWLLVRDNNGTTYKVQKQNAIPTVSNRIPQANFSNVQLLLHGESSPIIDSSNFKRNITNNNCIVETTQKKFDNGSIFFNGTNSHLILPPINILSNDFNIECEFFPLSLSGFRNIIGQWSQASGQGGWLLAIENSIDIVFYFGAFSNTSPLLTFKGGIILNSWQHIAVSRIKNDWFLYVEGILRAFARSSSSRTSLNVNLTLGNYYNNSNVIPASGVTWLHGYIDEIRISTEAIYYPESIQPITAHPDL